MLLVLLMSFKLMRYLYPAIWKGVDKKKFMKSEDSYSNSNILLRT